MTALHILAICALVVYLTFVHYSAVMNLQRVRDAGKLTVIQLPFAYAALGVGLVLDLTLNVLVSVLVLWTYPRHWLLTGTLVHFKREGPGDKYWNLYRRWHFWVATTLCAELLDSLDPHPSGCHCRID